MLMLIAVSLMVGAAVAQAPRENCCTPMQWEGFDDTVAGIAGKEGKDAMLETMHLHVDHTGKRVAARAFQYFDVSGIKRNFTVVDNYHTGKRAFVENGTCQVSTLHGDMMSNCIPAEHGHYGMYNIGAGENTLEVDAWSVKSSIDGEEVHLRTIRLDDYACVPYQRRTIYIAGAESSHPSFASFHSYNLITPGIEDDSVFETPDECKTVQHIDLPVVFEDALNAFRA